MCDMTHSYVWHDSFVCVTWHIRMCDMTHSYVWHDSLTCVTWLIHMCDTHMTHTWHTHDTHMTHTWHMTHTHAYPWNCKVIDFHKRAPYFTKEPLISAKDPCVSTKEPHILTVQSHTHDTHTHDTHTRISMKLHSHIFPQKSLLFQQKSPASVQSHTHKKKRSKHTHIPNCSTGSNEIRKKERHSKKIPQKERKREKDKT